VKVLVLNAGSSSLKHAVIDDGAKVLGHGVERWDPGARPGRHAAALRAAISAADMRPDAIGHRVVHGGRRFMEPTLIDRAVRTGIEDVAELAPVHNRAALEGIDAATEAFPGVPQVACFDTAFHHTIPEVAATYAIPYEWSRRHGIRRYGFHGLNVAWCSGRIAKLIGADASRRLIVCHLGSGCSVTALLSGRSIDTSMGFTPLDGVPMATRPGSLDPGLVLELVGHEGLEATQRGLNYESGLLGVSGRSPDLREVISGIDEGDERCRLAFDVFVRGVAAGVAAMTSALAGLDCLVFTAGAGEGLPRLREAMAARLSHLGVVIDAERNANAAGDSEISPPDEANPRVWVVRAGEETVIAQQTAAVLGRDP
jgi:acetate kinase